MSDPNVPQPGPETETELDEPGGSVGKHRPLSASRTIAVAATDGDALNTIRRRLEPRRCWALEDVRFAFDSSLITIEARREFTHLDRELVRGQLRLALFGHADPVGDDAYNKVLSGRRATAIYAALRRDVDTWERLYTQPVGGDDWGVRSIQQMLAALGHDPGPADGVYGEQTRAAVTAFQDQEGLAVDGVVGPNTRAALFAAYMDLLCADATGQPYTLGDDDFLGRGQQQDAVIDVQGCSEFNPIYLMSSAQAQALESDKPARNAENAPNRRVVGFMFDAGLEVPRALWPCPTVSEGVAACKAAFWPDGDARREHGEHAREHAKGGRTMACAFYDGLARFSPCEAKRGLLRLTLLDAAFEPIPSAEYEIVIGERVVRRGTADGEGVVVEPSLPIGPRLLVRFGLRHPDADPSLPLPHRTHVVIGLAGDHSIDADYLRLHNLGYPNARDNPGRVAAFQTAVGIEPALGEFDELTREAAREAHDDG